jgi:hypothetical protein
VTVPYCARRGSIRVLHERTYSTIEPIRSLGRAASHGYGNGEESQKAILGSTVTPER